ncbi:MAG: hypothetical protein ACI8UR_000997 [Natronomonas sp.]|jgi:hypothetical protein|uniref:hypothetical protein n=1 Tax=Natronomonas sp. TaxID=2184060 RepID=UPI00398A1B30
MCTGRTEKPCCLCGRPEHDQRPLESEMLVEARDIVEARIVEWSLDELDAAVEPVS